MWMKKAFQDRKISILALNLYLMFVLDTVSGLSFDHMWNEFLRTMDTPAGITSACLFVTVAVCSIDQAGPGLG